MKSLRCFSFLFDLFSVQNYYIFLIYCNNLY